MTEPSIAPLPRRISATLATAGILAALVAFVGPVSAAPTSPTSGNPRVIVGSLNGPVDVHGNTTYATIAHLSIPAGRWFITAKGYLQSTPATSVSCQLVAGSDRHAVTTAFDSNPSGAGQWQAFELMTTHVFSLPGAAALRCQTYSHTGDVVARYLRISAMQVGKLTRTTGSGAPTSTGSGKPEVRALAQDQSIHVTGTFTDVASLSLPAGLWWITAAATAGIHLPGDLTCRLVTPVDFDDTTITVPSHQTASMTVQVTHRYDTAGTVRLRCLGTSDQNSVSNIRIVAVRAGHLINRQIGGAEYNYGSGTPLIVAGFRDDGGTLGASSPVLGSLALPAGAWLLSAKLYLDPGSLNGLNAVCTLTAGTPVDQVSLTLEPNQRALVPLVGAHVFGSGGGTVRLVCRSSPGSPIHAYWIKVAAIKASVLTQKSL